MNEHVEQVSDDAMERIAQARTARRMFRIGLTVEAVREFTRMRIGETVITIDPIVCMPDTQYVLEADVDRLHGVISEGSVVMPRDEKGRPQWEVDGKPVVRPTEQLRRLLDGKPVYVPERRAD